jgi:hypothetical protein
VRRSLSVLGIVIVLGLGLGVWHPSRVGVQALLLLPDIFPAAPVDPLGWLASEPKRTEHAFQYAAGTIQADIFHPASGGRHGAVVLLPGVGEMPRIDLALRFAEALARSGVVVMLPQSTGLLAERLTFDEVDGLRRCFDLLQAQSDVDANRTGFIGLSAAGGLSIVAAAQSDLRERVRLVSSLGGYYDATALLLDAASRSIDVDGQVQPWVPDQRTLDVIDNALSDALGGTSPARAYLQSGISREQARALIEALPPSARERLATISPSHYLGSLRAHLYLLHDTDDSFVPFTQSRELVRAAPPGIVQRFTEFSIFAHVVPNRPVAWPSFLHDVWSLYWDVHAVLLELL